MKNNILKRSVHFIVSCFVVFMLFSVFYFITKADSSTRDVPVKSYEYGKEQYLLESDYLVSTMSYGKSSLGTFSVSGNINSDTYYNGYKAYGLNDGMLKFSYSYDGYLLDDDGEIHLVNDKTKKINNSKISDNILKGAIIIETSYNGKDWDRKVNPLVNFFEDNPKGYSDFYTTDGTDLSKGCFYRVIIAYMTQEPAGKGQFLWVDYDKTKDVRHAEVYEFFACTNSGQYSVHDLAANMDEVTKDADEVQINQIIAGETLLDGSTTTKGFKIDCFGNNYTIRVNGLKYDDGKTFNESGKYDIEVQTLLGKTSTMSVYVFNGGADMGYSSYFNDYLIEGKRVFREDPYPTYDVFSCISIKGVDENIPTLKGEAVNLTTGTTYEIASTSEPQSIKIEPGQYYVDLVSGRDCKKFCVN